jgi:hypothetical protein
VTGDGLVLAGGASGVTLAQLEREAERLKADLDAILAEACKQG